MELKAFDQIKEYSQRHPDASLSDFIADIEKEDLKIADKIRAKNEWYMALVGRYFNIGEYYFKVCIDEDGDLCTDSYQVYISDDNETVMVSRCDGSPFNYDIFCSPYEEPKSNRRLANEITEETFNKIVDKHKEIVKNIKNFLTTKHKIQQENGNKA